MFRHKENARLMPCLEDMSEGWGRGQSNFKAPDNNIDTFKEGEELISQYLELEKDIIIEEEKLNALKTKETVLLNKIMNNPGLTKLLSEISEKNCKTK